MQKAAVQSHTDSVTRHLGTEQECMLLDNLIGESEPGALYLDVLNTLSGILVCEHIPKTITG